MEKTDAIIDDAKRRDLEKQGYRIVGSHSAIKVCEWCKKSLKDEGICYKQSFYGIKCHRCVQMTPVLHVCGHRCKWCWRDIDFTYPRWVGPVDDPKTIVDGCIEEHIKYLHGFAGNPKTDMKRYEEAMKPLHFAISLSGEPTAYPYLPELIDEIRSRDMTAFLVTNGTDPDMLKRIISHQPTQLYITLPAPDKETYLEVCKPSMEDSWEKIMESLRLMKDFSCRKTVRLTLVKDENMIKPEKYAELLKDIDADYFEFKAYVYVGHSQYRLDISNMPRHPEIVEFASKVARLAGMKIIDEKKESRVVLIAKEDKKDRIMEF
jgi:tRNA wybutosine-synthesizing protein 1